MRLKPEFAVALAMAMHNEELECPTCEKPVEYLTYHRKCLTERCGGKIPQDIERLIQIFEIKVSDEDEG